MTRPAAVPAIDARGVRKVHRGCGEPVRALDGVDLLVERGEYVVVTGSSGAGKSTLLNCLAGLDAIDGGSVAIDGVDLAGLGDARRSAHRARSMGFVFQAFNLLPVLTAEQNVALPLRIAGVPRGAARRRARAELDRLGLHDRAAHLPTQLSGGEQQRVAIARATVAQPSILWADEPTGNLDRAAAEVVAERFHDVHRSGVTVVLVTHQPEAVGGSPRRITIVDGRVVEDAGTAPPSGRAQ